ncbi:unnamed protein product [Paramecium pentaurelia]|uniref:TLDc domain-containing protein n=1 Tax=Paramecium pentaurelia TaxID=43138 RepID=A0A8S1UUB9_9CILI|nr:unnamed protein product [Paramecium pentaurelia]
MNILATYVPEDREKMVCQMHKLEIIAIDLVSLENRQFEFLCCNCLVEKMNNNNISTIEQTSDRIQSYKSQRLNKRKKDIQITLDNQKILLVQIMKFKSKVDEALDKISNEIQKQLVMNEKEQQSLKENCQTQSNFQEDVRQLSEFLQTQENQIELSQDSKFIDDIYKQFELIFQNETHNKTIQTFKDVVWNINNLNKENKIELMSLQTQNNQKTLSLSNLCQKHKKEIIMIDIESENKQIEYRFVCVQCISDNPLCQYRTIEEVNQKWNEKMKKQDIIFNDLRSNRLKKKEKLNKKIAEMRQNYILQLDDISETLRTGFSVPTTPTTEVNKFKQDSIQQLSKEELFLQIQNLIQFDEEQLFQDSKIEFMITKDSLLSKGIENKLEQLKQHDQLDIQESINILQDQSNDNQIQGIYKLIQIIQEGKIVNQEQQIRKQELDEFISSSKQIYCQMELFNQTIKKFQDHQIKINSINNKIKLFQDHQNFKNLQIQVHDYKDKFDKDFLNFQKFSEIDKLVNDLETLKQNNKNLEFERNSMENNKIIQSEKENTLVKKLTDLQLELQKQKDEQKLLNENLQREKNNNDQQIQLRFDKLGLNLKPDLLQDYYWITLLKTLAQKVNKAIRNSILIYQGTRDGLNNQQYWSKVNGKGNLLMVFKSKSDHIFGGYSPCIWESCSGKYVADHTLSSFIFSQSHDQIYPLKYDAKQYAIYCNSNYGPSFGNGYDIKIGSDFADGYSKLGISYSFPNYKYGNYDPDLFGQIKPEIKECQIYELSFV